MIGDADHYRGIPKDDLALLRDIEAQKPRGETPIWNMLRRELRKP